MALNYYLCILLSLFSFLFVVNISDVGAGQLLSRSSNGDILTDFDVPACRIASRLRGFEDPFQDGKNVIAIGDVHGCFVGLTEILYEAGVTSSNDGSCHWRPDLVNTTLVQVGDIVDRGNATLSVWRCLETLQRTARQAAGSEVIRLIGNHDIWWLENQVHNRNKETDTPEVISEVASGMKKGNLYTL